jgi:predicted PhzF superfamily epimerase YddE/YHI9
MSPARRTLKFYQADVFTDEPFGGNPVAVLPDAQGLTDGELQQIAGEMNLSETVFVFPPTDAKAAAKVRIFTPKQEIPFAGHPILGTFYLLGKLKQVALQEPITSLFYECNIGVFPIELRIHKGEILRVVMTQPKPEFLGKVDSPDDIAAIAKALGMDKRAITDAKFPVEVVSTGLPAIIVPVRTLTAVRSIVPDPTALTDLCARHGANGNGDGGRVFDGPYPHVRAADRHHRGSGHGQRERRPGGLSRPERRRRGGDHDRNHRGAGLRGGPPLPHHHPGRIRRRCNSGSEGRRGSGDGHRRDDNAVIADK